MCQSENQTNRLSDRKIEKYRQRLQHSATTIIEYMKTTLKAVRFKYMLKIRSSYKTHILCKTLFLSWRIEKKTGCASDWVSFTPKKRVVSGSISTGSGSLSIVLRICFTLKRLRTWSASWKTGPDPTKNIFKKKYDWWLVL